MPIHMPILTSALLTLLGSTSLALASVTLDAGPVTPHAPLIVNLRLSGGCRGAATTALRVSVPDLLADLHPVPKAGWDATVTPVPGPATPAASEVTWRASAAEASPETFSLTGTVTDAAASGTILYFPVTQECGGETKQWTDVPAAGQELGALRHPAPSLEIASVQSKPHQVSLIEQLRVTQPWIRATSRDGEPTEAYLEVENRGGAPDRLTGALLEGADEVAIQPGTGSNQGAPAGLEVPPKGKLALKPNAAHLVVLGLHHPLNAGDLVRGTVRFERAGPLVVEFEVDKAPAPTAN
jgi:copper(I)-binding protein